MFYSHLWMAFTAKCKKTKKRKIKFILSHSDGKVTYLAKINRNNTFININKSYWFIILNAFSRYKCVFLDFQDRVNMANDSICKNQCGELMLICKSLDLVVSDKKKPRSTQDHVILFIYFHKCSILFKMNTIYCKKNYKIYTLDSIAQVLYHSNKVYIKGKHSIAHSNRFESILPMTKHVSQDKIHMYKLPSNEVCYTYY